MLEAKAFLLSPAELGVLNLLKHTKERTATLIPIVSKLRFLFGGGEEIRTLAPAKPTYRISNYMNKESLGDIRTI